MAGGWKGLVTSFALWETCFSLCSFSLAHSIQFMLHHARWVAWWPLFQCFSIVYVLVSGFPTPFFALFLALGNE